MGAVLVLSTRWVLHKWESCDDNEEEESSSKRGSSYADMYKHKVPPAPFPGPHDAAAGRAPLSSSSSRDPEAEGAVFCPGPHSRCC